MKSEKATMETAAPLSNTQIELLEELAHVNERSGMQPAMAKIISLLTVSEDTELTFDQIRDTLDLSKSAVSQAINQLLLIKKIDYKTKIGDRKRYFYLKVADFKSQILEIFNGVDDVIKIHQKILDNRSSKNKEFNQTLKDMIEFLTFLHTQAISFFKTYKESK